MSNEIQLITFETFLNTQYKQKILINMFILFEHKII